MAATLIERVPSVFASENGMANLSRGRQPPVHIAHYPKRTAMSPRLGHFSSAGPFRAREDQEGHPFPSFLGFLLFQPVAVAAVARLVDGYARP
jgi:hypothetical protein